MNATSAPDAPPVPPDQPAAGRAPARRAPSRLSRAIEGLVFLTPIILVAATGDFGDDARAGAIVTHPADDAVLVAAPVDPERAETARAEARLREHPRDLRLAVEIARRHIADARRNADPRALGWAEAALAPWWSEAEPPEAVALLRATIRQSRHEFAAALTDLDRVLARDPGNAQAALTRATVLGVVGRPADGRADCDRVAARAPGVAAAACHAAIDGLTGENARGRERLDEALAGPPAQDDGVRAWALGIRGELWQRDGDVAAAERDYRTALALDPGDAWTVTALSDLLLDEGRPAEVFALTGASDVDNLVLRRALASRALGLGGDDDHALLRARYDAAHARGDIVHLREEARLVLAFEDDPDKALALARADWEQQHEPWDALVLMRAAAAAGAPAAAAPAVRWLDATGIRDVALDRARAALDHAAVAP